MADITTIITPPLQQQREENHPPSKQKLMSIAYIRRHPDMTPEQFYTHWEFTHGVIVKPWAEKYGVVYTQIHLKRQYKDNVSAIGPENSDGAAPLDDYDGCALFEIDSFEQFAAAFEDEYYKSTIEPDERRFIDKKVGVMRVRGEVRKITV